MRIEESGIDAERNDDARKYEEVLDGMVEPGDGDMCANPLSERYSDALALRHFQGCSGVVVDGYRIGRV
jgi:hypothetical protein